MTTPIGRKSTSNLATTEAGGEVDEAQSKPKLAPAASPPVWASESSMVPPTAPIVHRAKSAFGRLVVDELAKEHRAHTDVNWGLFSGTLMVSEEVALDGSDSYRAIVAPDARRSAVAVSDPSQVWVKSRLRAGASVGLPLGGATFGFNGSVEVSSIGFQPRNFSEAAAGQARTMWLPVTAEGVGELHAPPGTEWVFRGQYGVSLGNAGPDAEYRDMSMVTGVAAGVSHQNIYTKNVKILEGSKVFVLLGKNDGITIGGALGGHISTLGAGKREGTNSNAMSHLADRKTSVTASIYGSIGWPHRQLGGAVLDLSKPADKIHYDYLLSANPLDAAAYIKANNLGANYEGDGTRIETGLKLKFGSFNLLSTSTLRGTESGELIKAGAKSQLSESSYNRIVQGALARLVLGEERTVSVRAGELIREDGASERAVAVRLTVNDPKVTSRELAEQIRFAVGMGVPVDGLPDPKSAESFEEGESTVEASLTDAQLKVLVTKTPDQVRLAFAEAQRDIEGADQLPTWFTQPEILADYRSQLSAATTTSQKGSGNGRAQVLRAYSKQFNGRDLERDLASASAANHALEEAAKCRGKPVAAWGGVLEAVGMQASPDMRAGLLALHRLCGAEVVQLSTQLDLLKVRATSVYGALPKSLVDFVGSVMLPN